MKLLKRNERIKTIIKFMTLSRRVGVTIHGISNGIIAFIANVSQRVNNRQEMQRNVVTLVKWNEHTVKDTYLKCKFQCSQTEWKSCFKYELFPCQNTMFKNLFSSMYTGWKIINIMIGDFGVSFFSFRRYKKHLIINQIDRFIHHKFWMILCVNYRQLWLATCRVCY